MECYFMIFMCPNLMRIYENIKIIERIACITHRHWWMNVPRGQSCIFLPWNSIKYRQRSIKFYFSCELASSRVSEATLGLPEWANYQIKVILTPLFLIRRHWYRILGDHLLIDRSFFLHHFLSFLHPFKAEGGLLGLGVKSSRRLCFEFRPDRIFL